MYNGKVEEGNKEVNFTIDKNDGIGRENQDSDTGRTDYCWIVIVEGGWLLGKQISSKKKKKSVEWIILGSQRA